MDRLNFLKSKPTDKGFHGSRIMFCLKDGKVIVGSRGTGKSHLEWFMDEGWLSHETAEHFMNNHTRGFYLPADNVLHSYRSFGFGFNDEVIEEVRSKLPEFKEALGLNDETKICFGPRDGQVGGVDYPRKMIGVLKDFLR